MDDTKNNVIPGTHIDDGVLRPAWVPAHAICLNGLWSVPVAVGNYHALPIPGSAPPMPPEVRRAILTAEVDAATARAKEGLPPGHYRHGGLIYGPDTKVAVNLSGGYIDDGSRRPGYAEKRAARIALITEKRAAHQQAIDEFEAAKLRMEEAEAEAFHAYNVLTEA